MDFAIPADQRVKLKESEKWDKYQDFTRELKKEYESDADIYYKCCTQYTNQMIAREFRRLGNGMTSRDHLNYSITKSASILRKVLESWEDLLCLKLQWKTIN